MPARVSADFHKQLEGYGLTTAVITYRLPDRPKIVNPNTFTWQDYDLCPKFPELFKFLAFWQKNLDGPIHSVLIAHSQLIKPAEFNIVDGMTLLH